jgi:hypothetical protein
MNASDRDYFSRYSLDSATGSQDDLYAFEFSYDNQTDPFDDGNLLDAEDIILEDDFLNEI